MNQWVYIRASLVKRLGALTLLAFTILNAYAQPANDDCSRAREIRVPAVGYGLGTFSSDSVDLTGATVQAGEHFDLTLATAGLDRRSV